MILKTHAPGVPRFWKSTLLAALQAHRHPQGDRVLMNGSRPVDRAWIAYWMRKAQRRANMLRSGRVRILRHTYCSRLAMLGVATTMRYMHLSPQVKGQAVAALDAAIEGVPPWSSPRPSGGAKIDEAQ